MRTPHFSRQRSRESLRPDLDESIEALARVDDALMRLDHYYIPSTITRLWKRRETVRLERFIIETLQDCTARVRAVPCSFFFRFRARRGASAAVTRKGGVA